MEKIRYIRERMGLSQADLAAAVGVERSTVTKWESTGTFPRAEKIVDLCKVLSCTPNDLFDEEVTNFAAAEG